MAWGARPGPRNPSRDHRDENYHDCGGRCAGAVGEALASSQCPSRDLLHAPQSPGLAASDSETESELRAYRDSCHDSHLAAEHRSRRQIMISGINDPR